MVQLYRHGDKLYKIRREIPTHNFQKKGTNHLDMEFVKAWRDWLGVDHVLRTQTSFLFVETVEDIEYEEINNEKQETL